MTQKEVLRKIIDLLRDELKVYDFSASFKDQGFVRKTNSSIFFLQLLIYNRTVLDTGNKGFLIEPYIWIGVNEIEKYYKRITLNSELKSEINFITIGNSFASLLANPDGIYRIRNKSLGLHVFEEKHIPLVVEQLIKGFKEVALPYCLNNDNVAMVDTIVNTNPEEYKVHMMNDNYRIIKGIIAAKLNHNPNLDKIISIYEKQIVDRDMYNATDEMARLLKILPTIQS